jgi:methyl-accepting chemotaxis protein
LLREIESGNELSAAQQAETDQIATAVNQMAASIQEVASNALNAADAAGRADSETSSGQRLVADTSQSIGDLEAEIRQAAKRNPGLKTKQQHFGSSGCYSWHRRSD